MAMITGDIRDANEKTTLVTPLEKRIEAPSRKRRLLVDVLRAFFGNQV
jgi:hypothetical protein